MSEPGESTPAGTTVAGFTVTRADRDATAVLLTVMAVLLASTYLGRASEIDWLVTTLDAVGLDAAADRVDHAMGDSVHAQFNRRVYFAVTRIIFYLVPAWMVGRWVLRRPMRDLGWRIDRSWAHIRVYVALYGLMLPLVVLASTQESFQHTYPFYTPNQWESFWPWFVVWELVYFGQFIALELFFRGFGVHGLAPRLGILAVPVMVVPYLTIHFSKPFPEAVGSIVAGTVLGVVSLRQGSAFWGGILHFAVALTMDALAY